jgi:hypothetical protein
MPDAGISWRSGLWETSRERRVDRAHRRPYDARCIARRSASDLDARRAAGRRIHTESHAWPDGRDPRESARDPGAGQRQARVRPHDMAVGGLSEPSVLRLPLGIVPGSVTDEDSPFKECAHAYLAAGRALLLQLNREPQADHKSIDALTSKIEVEMLADAASLNFCRYSDEPFNTNEIIWPHWGMAPFHAPTLATFGAALTLLAAAAFGLMQATTPSGVRGVA